MRKALVTFALGVLIATGFLVTASASPVSVTAGPTVDLTGQWGFITSQVGATTFGECIVELAQSGSTISNVTTVECEVSGSPVATGGSLKNCSISGLSLTCQVNFENLTVPGNFDGTVSPDGNSQQGTWAFKNTSISGTYVASRMLETTSGSNVQVRVPASGATVTFTNVTEGGGTTSIRDDSTSGTLPGQFEVLGQFYHVLTTATVTGDINVCVGYQDKDDDGIVDGTSPPVDETTLQLLHNEGGTFVDRTSTSKTDFDANVICAVVGSLSEFALGFQAPTPTPTPRPPALGGVAAYPDLRSGGSAGVLAGVAAGAAAAVLALGGAAWVARRRRVS